MDDFDPKVMFGNRVRQLRKNRGWSQEEFAHRVGLDRSYMGGVSAASETSAWKTSA